MGKGNADVKFLVIGESVFLTNNVKGSDRECGWHRTHEVEMPRCQAAEPPLLLLRGAPLAEAER